MARGKAQRYKQSKRGTNAPAAVAAGAEPQTIEGWRQECERLRGELAAARGEIAAMRARQEQVLNRIDWVLDSLDSLQETD